MKLLFFSFFMVCITVTSFATDTYYTATVYLKDGAVKNGLAVPVEYVQPKIVFFFFKMNNESEIEIIESLLIEKIIYTIDDKEEAYVYINTYGGWKMNKILGLSWLKILKEGTATLFTITTIDEVGMGTNHGGRVY